MSLRVGVTGSSGFIGRHVVTSLAQGGHTAVPLRRPFELATLTSSLRSVDVVVHLAGVVSAARDSEFEAGNVGATRLVAQAARDAGVRLVHISSLAAAGPAPPASPRIETDPPAPINAYGRTKLAGETVVRETAGLRWTILRPGVVYGPGDRALGPLFASARRGVLPLIGGPMSAYTFIYVDDAVRAILAAVEQTDSGDTIFLGHREPVTPRALVEAVASTLGVRAALIPIPRLVVRLAAVAGDVVATATGAPTTINTRRFAELYSVGFVCRVDRMAAHLGVAAEVGLREGLERSKRWYVERRL